LLAKEIEEVDDQWVDYEMEDAQSKMDLADMILEDMIKELTEFLDFKIN